MNERRLQELSDHHAIRECMQRYARGIDRADEELVRSAFHPDAVDCHAQGVAVTQDEFFRDLFPRLRERVATMHYLLNQSIDVDGDVAHVETYLLLVKQDQVDGPVEQMGGRYLDRFEKRDDEWKIALRMLVFDWHMIGDGSRSTAALAREHRGAADRTDPSYERPLRPRA